MNALVIYDSAYGNTAKIAQAIAEGLGCPAKLVGDISEPLRTDMDLLVVGSPTQGGRPLDSIVSFINGQPRQSLQKTDFAAFDTRFDIAVQKLPLRLLMRTIGYAAEKIAAALQAVGRHKAVAVEGFIVSDKEGPLQAGELERARAWGQTLRHNLQG